VGSFVPKSIICLRDYNFHKFFCDLSAGLTVGLVALPLAMAFAISSGVPPQAGLYCAIISGFLISLLGGSKMQIGGPTGAFVVVVYGIVAQYGMEGLLICTMMAGVILVVLGVTGLGNMVRFIPHPVVVGFTNGIAVLIASTQIKEFLGLEIAEVPGEFVARLESLFAHLPTISAPATTLAVITLVVVLLGRRYFKRIPGSTVALVLGTLSVALFQLPVATIGSQFGGLPSGLPTFSMPPLSWDTIGPLISPAITVAALGALESLLSAVVADRMSGDKHQPNVELVAQGIANIMTPLFGGLPATGAIARTATNIRSGATSPVAGMIHALTLLAFLLFAAPLAQYIPLAVLAAILLVVAYNMGEWKEIPKLLKLSWADISVWLVTFLLTVFSDLTRAVEVGIVLAGLLYIRKVTTTTTVSVLTKEYVEEGRAHILQDNHIPDYATVIRIHGPFLFGAAEKMADVAERLEDFQAIIILRLRNMTAIDATGLLALEEFADKLHASHRTLILCGARTQPAQLMRQAEFERHIGPENICPNIQVALLRAKQLHAKTLILQKSA
jgi:sulfate permease, SulP family